MTVKVYCTLQDIGSVGGVPISAIKLRRSTQKRPLECVGNILLQCTFEGMHGTRICGAYEYSIFTGVVVAEQLRDIFLT